MSKALILDFGGVITRTLFETHTQTETMLGLPKGSLYWYGPFDSDSDPLWQDMIANKISERDYWLTRAQEVGGLLGKNWTSMQEFVVAARSDNPEEVIRPEFLDAIKKVKLAGKQLAILSNELDLFYGNDFREKLPFITDFDAIIDATHTKILKPAPEAYKLVIEALDVTPQSCIFVDDQMRNIVGAREFGMQTVHFDIKNPQASYNSALTKLGLSL